MPQFAANLSMMFNEVPFLDRFKAASAAGFTAVEFLFPYEYSPEEVAAKAKAAGTQVVLFNMPAGNWGAGERGITGLPGREQEFREGVETGVEIDPHYVERYTAIGCYVCGMRAKIEPDHVVDLYVENMDLKMKLGHQKGAAVEMTPKQQVM